MTKKALVLAALPAFVLCACGNGTKKVDFKTFVEEVGKIELKEPEKATVKGKVDDKSYNFTIDDPEDLTLEQAIVYGVIETSCILLTTAAVEVKDAEYFVGNGFKFKDKVVEKQWDKHGSPTKLEGKIGGVEYSLSISTSYK